MGRLYIVATPIGNLEDISARALRVFSETDVLVCEDTRKTRKIFSHFDIARPSTVFSYHEHNEENAGKRILGLLEAEQTVALCSDGGYPGISDPGYRIIRDAIASGHDIEVIPGPSSVPVALLLSGLPTSSYTFKGFPPRKSGPRKRFLEAERDAPHTLIILESPYRVVKLLVDALEVLGDRQAAVCIELTKKFERAHRGPISELIRELEGKTLKGEITVVIAGNHPKFIKS
ncbi:MAG: 16S rRNA (cytidine(1402)-2'-O)-methyltransferase [Candidatus Hydrogenedentes bacterium]|nr:16S rRNA (cytidine(1402)-2'-O)-methyltransferase [Candidatus Hydrogenedentota bacterium]